MHPANLVSSPIGRWGSLGQLLTRCSCRSAIARRSTGRVLSQPYAKFAKHLDLVVNRALAASLPMISGTGPIAAAVEEECPRIRSTP